MIRAAFLFFCLPSFAMADCAVDRLDLRGEFGTARFTVEVADDARERARGLMHREDLARSAGMLFVYDAPLRAQFWMKDTPLPLDLIFMDPSGTVTRIHENAVPFDLTTIDGGPGVQYVLEINGGLARMLGLSAGDEMRHPALGDQAHWAC